jgi:hypothetical protein
LSKPRRFHSKPSFKAAIASRKRIVEIGGPRKITHREAIEPLERARAFLSIHYNIHLKFAGKHREKYNIGIVCASSTARVACLANRVLLT